MLEAKAFHILLSACIITDVILVFKVKSVFVYALFHLGIYVLLIVSKNTVVKHIVIFICHVCYNCIKVA